jgi:NAD(P)-dependent dehydrogenase (short-subunit alcohol dehydrogenase family)
MTKRTAVVVGVGAEIGLGAALCRRFASEGLQVMIAGRTPGKLEQVVTSILAAGGSAETVRMDATNEADVVKLFDRAMAPGKPRS